MTASAEGYNLSPWRQKFMSFSSSSSSSSPSDVHFLIKSITIDDLVRKVYEMTG
ncbi:MAG: hypothetical protein ACJ71P_14695 [Nitrososphaeraceae archaeon]|jgi:hypothetical protein